MADDDKRKFEIPWATLLPLLAAFAGVVAQLRPLVSARPSIPSEKSIEVTAEQDVDARLWQDPLAVAQKSKTQLDSDLLTRQVPENRVKRHQLEALVGKVAQLAGAYGMMLQAGAPVTAGPVGPGSVRVIVSRTRAEVPGCPNWSQPSQPNYNNRMLSNFGCGVNANIAAMVANPEDLVHGRESGIGTTVTGTKAITLHQTTEPTGKKGLQHVSPKGGN